MRVVTSSLSNAAIVPKLIRVVVVMLVKIPFICP
jgi:hypothetical protein